VNEGRIRFQVPSSGGRLDVVLVAHTKNLSRTRLQQLIRSKQVTVNGVITTKPGYQLEGGELIELSIPEPTPVDLEPESIPLNVVFENKDLLIINKPAGMVVHPSYGHDRGTLVHAVLAHAPDIEGVGGKLRPGVVHRLDKDTSGLILMAKNDLAHRAIQGQFKEREVDKRYLALVDGRPPTPSGKIEAPIGRDPHHRKRMATLPPGRGREAVTFYYLQEAFADHSLLEINPRTGRTHQIRVHMSFIGCPVVGDRIYGWKKPSLPVDRMFLHAHRLTFSLPGEKTPQSFEAELPLELNSILDELRIG
jgi:23S rRNA pseudouridine1911/1915/1917 synthase